MYQLDISLKEIHDRLLRLDDEALNIVVAEILFKKDIVIRSGFLDNQGNRNNFYNIKIAKEEISCPNYLEDIQLFYKVPSLFKLEISPFDTDTYKCKINNIEVVDKLSRCLAIAAILNLFNLQNEEITN